MKNRKNLLRLLSCLLSFVTFTGTTWGASVWEQITGSAPPVEIKIPTIAEITRDPVGSIVNPPIPIVSQTGIPSTGDIVELAVKNPDQLIEFVRDPQYVFYAPVAAAMLASRNAVIKNGGAPIPPEVKQVLAQWYSKDLLDSIRWTANWGPLTNSLQAAQMSFNRDTQAITVMNAIIFRDASLTSDIALWAHEVLHSEQYRNWGLHKFAKEWVDNSSPSGTVEAPAYARQLEVAAVLRSGGSQRTIQTVTTPSTGLSQAPQPAAFATGAPANPQFAMRCIFPSDRNMQYYVTHDNKIVAFTNGINPMIIGAKAAPRAPHLSWTYQLPNGVFDVTTSGQIWAQTGPNQFVQVGFVVPPDR